MFMCREYFSLYILHHWTISIIKLLSSTQNDAVINQQVLEYFDTYTTLINIERSIIALANPVLDFILTSSFVFHNFQASFPWLQSKHHTGREVLCLVFHSDQQRMLRSLSIHTLCNGSTSQCKGLG